MTLRKSLSSILITIIVLTFTAAAFAADVTTPVTPAKAGVVNLNSADAPQLMLLPRIGQKAALRIIEFRKVNGSFKSTTELMQVKGIGDKSYKLLSPYLTVEGKTTLASKQHAPRKPRAPKAKGDASSTAR
jgi:competence protein ComEA